MRLIPRSKPAAAEHDRPGRGLVVARLSKSEPNLRLKPTMPTAPIMTPEMLRRARADAAAERKRLLLRGKR